MTQKDIKCSMRITYYDTFVFYMLGIPIAITLLSFSYLLAVYLSNKYVKLLQEKQNELDNYKTKRDNDLLNYKKIVEKQNLSF